MDKLTIVAFIALVIGPLCVYCAEYDVKVTIGLPTKKNRYVRMMATLPDMMELTMCTWFKPYKTSGLNHILSYSSRTDPDNIRVWLTQPAGENTTIGMNICGDKLAISINDNGIIKNNTWTHVCFGWSSWSFSGYIHLDGEMGFDLIKKSDEITDINQLKIETGGVMVLGQDQDVYGGGFEAKEAFAGELYDLQIWNERLKEIDAKRIGLCGNNFQGDALSWITDPMSLRDVYVQQFKTCRPPPK